MPSASQVKQAALLESPETLGTVVHAILRDRYGEEVYSWEPLTVALEVKDDFGVDMPAQTMDRWCAMQLAMTSDAFFKRLDAFAGVCNTLSGGSPFFDTFDPVTPEEIAWAVSEVGMNRDMLPFSYTIRKYVRTVLSGYGYGDDEEPGPIGAVFDRKPGLGAIRKGIAALGNDRNIGSYIMDNMKDMAFQFNQVPGLSKVDDELLEKGLLSAMGIGEVK